MAVNQPKWSIYRALVSTASRTRTRVSGWGQRHGSKRSLDHAVVPDVVRDAARLEQPSTLRTLATVGGTIGARDPESVLTTALLAYDAIVGFADERELPLGDVLRDGLAPGDLITHVDITNTGTGAIARTGRTPADKPIVAAVGRTSDGGLRIALSGVGAVPMVVDPDKIEDLEPPGDFRGSTPYRRHLAATLTARVEGMLSMTTQISITLNGTPTAHHR